MTSVSGDWDHNTAWRAFLSVGTCLPILMGPQSATNGTTPNLDNFTITCSTDAYRALFASGTNSTINASNFVMVPGTPSGSERRQPKNPITVSGTAARFTPKLFVYSKVICSNKVFMQKQYEFVSRVTAATHIIKIQSLTLANPRSLDH